jgi:hypothetical protein
MNHEEISELEQNLRRAERLRERTRIARAARHVVAETGGCTASRGQS